MGRVAVDMGRGVGRDGGIEGLRFQKLLDPVVDGAAEGPAEGWQKVVGAFVAQVLF